ncbi:MAG: hypothetical protein J5730_00830 [Bacteroidales bacterium]|nr:hypothetical protein [Bacteroidales bacterium]
MKTIFELIRIYTSSKARYPLRKTRTYDLGLFSTLAKAETQMRKDVNECQEYEQERLKDIAEDEESRNDEKRFGHEIVLAYKITEYELDMEIYNSTQSVRTYTADGQPNDECLLDTACERHFKGRTPDQIRFQPGDIVEVITEWRAELCVVGHAQPTTEDYANYRKRCWEECRKDCSKPPCCDKSIDYKEEYCRFHWDYSDDGYLTYSLGEGDTHFHPESPLVFRPTKPVSKALREKLRAKLEEMKRLHEP